MSVLRRINDWTIAGALGPLLAMIGFAAVYGGSYNFPLEYSALGKTLALAFALSGLMPVICGLVLTIRPSVSYWLAVIAMVFPVTAALAYYVAVPPIDGLHAGLWVSQGLLVGLYAYHCHRPAHAQ